MAYFRMQVLYQDVQMARRRSSFLEDLYDIAAVLPWWVGAVAALVAYVLLHSFSVSDPAVAVNHKEAMKVAIYNSAILMAGYLQYIVPGFLLAGSLASAWRGAKRWRLFSSVTKTAAPNDLDRLTWRQFENLVHEFFRKEGYSVVQTAEGPDGGIDLKLRKGRSLAIVQCKNWRRRKVDVKVVREQLGVMTANGAEKCFVVTPGDYTSAAREFARGQPIGLIDGQLLRRLLRKFTPADDGPADDFEVSQHLDVQFACPNCNAPMVLRTARRGRHSGSEFWGCSRYPACRGIRQSIRAQQ